MGTGDLKPSAPPDGRRNREVADYLRGRADALESESDNPFRVQAYRNAASRIERLSEDLGEVARQGRLREIPGVGRDLARRILEILGLGEPSPTSETKTEPFVETIRLVTGCDAASARRLYHDLHIRTLSDLEQIIRSHLLMTLPGADRPSSRDMLDRLRSLTDATSPT